MDRRVGTLVSLALLVPVLVSAQTQRKVVFVSAMDRTGSPVVNLTAADFEVLVGGVKQGVTRATFSMPMRIVLLVDASAAVSPMLTFFRGGLNAFVDAMPAGDEIAVISTAGQIGVRQAPTTDRTKLHAVIDRFAPEGGGNAFLDALVEADKRFLKNVPDRWPVFVILTTDAGEMQGSPDIEEFNAFVHDFVARVGSAHAIVVHGQRTGLISDVAGNLVNNAGGVYDPLAISNSLADRMKALAARVAADHQAMANRYAIEYAGNAKATQPVEVRIPLDGITIAVSTRRPF